MDLVKHYNNLYDESILQIASGNYQIDKLIDSPSDNRFGLTLLIRPDKSVKSRIQKFLSTIKAVEPDQYYYPDSDIHVTVMSIISCYAGFDLAKISVSDYVEMIKQSITPHKKFEIAFKGITASPSGIMIQGFLNDDTLTSIRDNLRENFRISDLEQTIDKRYVLQTAHSTVVRFRQKLTRVEKFVEVLEAYRGFDFGAFTVNALELVYNDWYQRKEHVKELYKFPII